MTSAEFQNWAFVIFVFVKRREIRMAINNSFRNFSKPSITLLQKPLRTAKCAKNAKEVQKHFKFLWLLMDFKELKYFSPFACAKHLPVPPPVDESYRHQAKEISLLYGSARRYPDGHT